VLMNGEGAVDSVRSCHECQPSSLPGRGKRALLVDRLDPRSVRQDPDLQEVNDFHTRRVVLAVGDAAPGAHVLKLVLAEHGAFPGAVLVCQGTIENVGEDFHVAVLMRAESSTG